METQKIVKKKYFYTIRIKFLAVKRLFQLLIKFLMKDIKTDLKERLRLIYQITRR